MMIKLGRMVSQKLTNQSLVDLIHDWKDVGGHPFLQRRDTPDQVPTAPAFFVGWQEGTHHIPAFPLYTLTEAIPGHSQWSTVSGRTLEDAGFRLPSEHSNPQDVLNWIPLPTKGCALALDNRS